MKLRVRAEDARVPGNGEDASAFVSMYASMCRAVCVGETEAGGAYSAGLVAHSPASGLVCVERKKRIVKD